MSEENKMDGDTKSPDSLDLDLGAYLKQLSKNSRATIQDRLIILRPETSKKVSLDEEKSLMSPRSVASTPDLGTVSSSPRKGSSPRPGCKKTLGSNLKTSLKISDNVNSSTPPVDLSPRTDGELYEGTHFTKEEGQKLCDMITLMLKSQEKPQLDFDLFKTMMKNLSLSKCYMITRVFNVIDDNKEGKITPEQFIRGLSILLRGSLEEQIRFAFKVYDMEVTGFITREDVATCISESIVPTMEEEEPYGRPFNKANLPPESIQGLVDMVFPKLDTDKDGMISCTDFRSACLKDPTLVEALGPCLPKDCVCHNAHRVLGVGDAASVSNQTNNLDYLTKTSFMARLCTPVNTVVDRVLSPIDLKK